MDSSEFEMHKAMTVAFIMEDPTSVVMQRREKVSDGAGGWRLSDTPSPVAQTVRLIPQSDKVPEVVSFDGTRARLEFILMGEADADIKRYDTFRWGDGHYQVMQVHKKPAYETKADVVIYRGS